MKVTCGIRSAYPEGKALLDKYGVKEPKPVTSLTFTKEEYDEIRAVRPQAVKDPVEFIAEDGERVYIHPSKVPLKEKLVEEAVEEEVTPEAPAEPSPAKKPTTSNKAPAKRKSSKKSSKSA